MECIVFLLRILTGLLLTFLPKVEILLLMIEEFDPKTEANNVFQIVLYVSASWTILQGCWHIYSFLLSSWKNAIKHQVVSIQLRALGNIDLFVLIIVFAALNENNAFGGNGEVSSQSLLVRLLYCGYSVRCVWILFLESFLNNCTSILNSS